MAEDYRARQRREVPGLGRHELGAGKNAYKVSVEQRKHDRRYQTRCEAGGAGLCREGLRVGFHSKGRHL